MIVLWNTGHVEEIIHQQQTNKDTSPEEYLKHIFSLEQNISLALETIFEKPLTKQLGVLRNERNTTNRLHTVSFLSNNFTESEDIQKNLFYFFMNNGITTI